MSESGQVVGELSWNHSTRILKIKGTIFRDGDFRFDDDGTVVHYQGRGIIYTVGHIEFDEQVCAGGSGTLPRAASGIRIPARPEAPGTRPRI